MVGLMRHTPRTGQVVLRIMKLVLADAKSRGQVVDERIFSIKPARYLEREPRFPSWDDADELAVGCPGPSRV
jgi:hypothetical protein